MRKIAEAHNTDSKPVESGALTWDRTRGPARGVLRNSRSENRNLPGYGNNYGERENGNLTG